MKAALPMAMPTIAPVESFFECEDDVEVVVVEVEFVGVAEGMERVGVREAAVTFWVKYTAKSALLNPPAGAVAVAPPNDLNSISILYCLKSKLIKTYEPPTTEIISGGTT